ncbi:MULTISPECIES: hypothetical protein [unclassified Desulfovibrio]|uniref:hypothetical protein n=1 Tax=unclassified Desulfovibrio TaxID=2593640 RepID=UPI000F5FF2D3|nr:MULTISPECIES: hypothetical protein [unclassified Desulfovibrio]RRD69812.1 hypothetical protein EII24_08815 [Desulfovibrio sp. OH1209_COT-279]RRD86423.1 hypothetical protein EII23_08815 [Desulfovibrio sp. OH1186_COT-070]
MEGYVIFQMCETFCTLSIDAQAAVVNKGQAYWAQVDDFCRKNKIVLSPKERGVLDIALTMPRRIPTEQQCGVLVQLEKRIEETGMQFSL